MKKDISASDQLRKLYPEEGMATEFSRDVTFQLTEDCTLRCTYCYQHCKSPLRMTWETGKKIVDFLFKMYDDDIEGAFITKKTKQIILDFIGGEPLLEVELMDKICDYFWSECIRRNHEWTRTFMISMASNGTEYFKPECQEFLKKYRNHLSYSVSIDGPKEMHDACRIFPNGTGSFDVAYAAQQDYHKHFANSAGTKATLAKENLPYLAYLIKYYVNEGYEQIHANCVYEAEWNYDDAKLFYNQLKETADYLLSLDKEIELALFEENFFKPKQEDDDQTWCFVAGTPILTNNGYKPIETLKVGDLVYTHTGELKPIENIMSHKADNVVGMKCSGDFERYTTSNHKFFVDKFNYVGWKNVKHYFDTDKISLEDISKKDKLHLFKLPEGTVNYNKSLAYLVGRYIGDGWTTQNGGTIPSICCGFSEKEDLEKCFSDANIKYHCSKSKTTFDFYTTKKLNKDSENYKEFYRITKLCGNCAKNKRIPEECFNWDKVSLKSLIDGYVSADGYLKSNGLYSCNTISEELANDLLLILRTIGYNPTCYINRRGGKSKILGRDVLIHDRYEIYWYSDSNRTKYIKQQDKYCTTYGVKTRKIESQEVFNITVKDNHSYVAGGYVVSNCGGYSSMLAFDPNGDAFPCIRYMHSSLADKQPAIKVGSVDDGIYQTEEDKKILAEMQSVTRRTQSTDECFYCPIAEGCSYCAAYNYELTGKINSRATRICVTHQARSLANAYYWNKKYINEGIKKYFHIYLPDEISLKIIDQDELNYLKELEEKAKENSEEMTNDCHFSKENLDRYYDTYHKSLGQNDAIEEKLHKDIV